MNNFFFCSLLSAFILLDFLGAFKRVEEYKKKLKVFLDIFGVLSDFYGK